MNREEEATPGDGRRSGRVTDLIGAPRVPGAAHEAPRRGAAPAKSSVRSWITFILLICYTGFVLFVTLIPRLSDLKTDALAERLLGVLHRVGVPAWFGYDKLEFTMNVAMFIPLGFLVGLALSRRWIWLGVFLLPAFSASIEWAQGALLAERVSDIRDVVANGVGGWIGLLVAVIIRAIVWSRDQKVIERAMWDAREGRR